MLRKPRITRIGVDELRLLDFMRDPISTDLERSSYEGTPRAVELSGGPRCTPSNSARQVTAACASLFAVVPDATTALALIEAIDTPLSPMRAT